MNKAALIQFALGAGVAALGAIVTYAEVLPSPWGALATMVAPMITLYMAQPHKAAPLPPEESK